MVKTPINQVLAENLALFMRDGPLKTQAALAHKAALSQRTIGNYLSPQLRVAGSRGKAPSTKLAELERIADALQIEVWQLLRPMSATDRVVYRHIEQAFDEVRALTTGAAPFAPPVLHQCGKRYGT